jgi:hypothetical protein
MPGMQKPFRLEEATFTHSPTRAENGGSVNWAFVPSMLSMTS